MSRQRPFELVAPHAPAGDQPQAIERLVAGLERGEPHQVLVGVTGSGKTFTIANTIARCGRPTLVIAPNKTLAAQLFLELRELFPHNAVEYFVSYYDYYQPEAYLPRTDTYIEKDAIINDKLDRLRHSATRSMLSRRDVIIVASVSCIYGLGSPEAYERMSLTLELGQRIEREEILRALAAILYRRGDMDFRRGCFRARGDVVDVFPAYEDSRAVRIELWGDEIEAISEFDPLTGERFATLERVTIYPKSHYVTPEELRERAIESITVELEQRLAELRRQGKLLEAQRLETRTRYDLEILREVGTCPGIENYSRHLTGRAPGEPPPTLVDYFPADGLFIIDESHVTIPQIGGMYRGDMARKKTLVEHGFRLPSALDNRPLRFEEFEAAGRPRIYVSATPGDYELEKAGAQNTIEQIVRPTGLVDPPIEIRPTADQVMDLKAEVEARARRGERVLVTTLTKRMAEDLAEFLVEHGVRAKYMHADIDTIERAEILKALREGQFDCLIGINLLREGLDLPEVSLVAILDADRPGFLRSRRSLIQTCGRAARNAEGRVILYADEITPAMRETIEETERRRKRQLAHNARHGIVPRTIRKRIHEGLMAVIEGVAAIEKEIRGAADRKRTDSAPPAASAQQRAERIAALREAMLAAARRQDFEEAARLRDEIFALEDNLQEA
ncbi:MAG: excinuclease ABC subunit UvrB [Planctomycetota bacterium]|nr:MAG: excinuclease ABC subunit UvrB [Planctomycetota bacterium]